MTFGVGPSDIHFAHQRLELNYTFEDFAEANRVYATGGRPGKTGKALFGWTLFLGLVLLLFLLLMRNPAASPTTAPAPAPVAVPVNSVLDALLPLIPWLVIFGFLWFVIFRVQKKQRSRRFAPSVLYASQAESEMKQAKGYRGPGRAVLVFIIAVTTLLVIFLLLSNRSAGNGGDSDGASDHPILIALLPILPWVMIFAFLWFIFHRQLRGKGGIVRQGWESQPQLQRPAVLEISESGTRYTDAVMESRYSWDGFVRVRESPNLFLLCPSYMNFIMVPKRAFADAEAMSVFRELVRMKIAERPSPAFPVLPLPVRTS